MNDSNPVGKRSSHLANFNTAAASSKLIIRPRMILLSMLVLIFFAFGVYSEHLHRHCMDAEQQAHRVVELIGNIKQLDEILTMSAHMAAATGDLQWERRYNDFEPQLDDAIKEAIALSPTESMRKAANKTNLANLRLVAIENKVFNLVRQGEREKAVGLLNSREYIEQKGIYKDGMSKLTVILQNNMQNRTTKSYRMFLGTVIVLAVFGSLLLFAWGTVLQMRKHLAENKQAEKVLRESEDRYKSLFQGTAEGIIVADTETKEFKYVNPAICKMLGYTEEELGRFGVCDIHPKADMEHAFSELEAQARGEKILAPEIPCLRKDGTIMYADIKTSMVMIDGRKCNIGFFTDVTEHKQLRADLENYKDKVLKAQKHAYIASMGAIVAHQINQPLTKINILLDRAIEQIEEASCSPSALKNVKEGLDEAKKAASIIQKFRQYSKDSALEGTGNVNLSAVADRIVSVLSERATQAKMCIAIKDMGDLLEVEANETALEQIFLIIIQNAIEAADGRKRHKLDIAGKFTDGNIELQFSDDCCGIAPENLDRIFEPFFSTKANGKGMGLGLDIVQQILISCSGEIKVESQLGKGTTFYVTLPVSNSLKA